jgi:Nucleolar pre-ribosomal-associated protein 1
VTTKETGEMDVEGEGVASDASGEKEKTLYLLSLLLRIIEAYIKTVPSLVAQAGFELTRLIDEVVPWSPKQSAQSAMDTLTTQIKNLSTILGPVIRALKHATTSRHCKWFGTSEDCVKAITQLVVNQDWDMSVKRSPFAKLLLLSKCSTLEKSDPELSSSAKSLVKSILKQSGMFQGHGEVDLELRTEQASWLEAIAVTDKSILLLDCIFRVAYHWNTETCIDTTDRIGKHTSGQGYQVERPTVRSKGRDASVVAPISPVMSCAMNLCSSNFDNISSRLPRHIKVHVDTVKDAIVISSEAADAKEGDPSVADSTAFLMKYSTGFRAELQEMLLGVAVTSALKARNPDSYGQCLLAVTGKEVLPGSDGGFFREMTGMTTLLSVSPSSSAIPSNKKAANSAAHLPHIIRDIADRADIASTIMLGSVLERVQRGEPAAPSDSAKRLHKQGTSSDSDLMEEDGKSVDDTSFQVRLHSATIAFVVHNIEQVQTCYNVFVSDESSADDARVGSFLRCIDAVGLFSAYLCCCQGQGQLGAPFYHFISALALRKMNLSGSANESSELEQKASTIVESVRLLRVICDRYSLAVNPATGTKSKKTANDAPDLGMKRKTRSASVDEQDGGIRSAISEAASMVTSLVVELVRQTSCAPLVADALNSVSLLDGMTDPNSFGKFSRSILCAAASAYFRRSNSRKKILDPNSISGTEHVTPALWLRVSERLLVAQETPMDVATAATAVQKSGTDIFSLGWMVQHFVDNSVLRSKFVDLALRDGQGHSLLSLNRKVAAIASPFFALIPLDAVCVSVLQSASAATLAMALNSHSLIGSTTEGLNGAIEAAKEAAESGSSAGARSSNALSCVSVRLESNNSTSLPFVSSFISPLSLMKVAGDRTLESQIHSPNAIYRLAPLCATLIDTDKSSPCPCKAFFALTLPICLGKKDLSLWDTVKIIKDGDFGAGLPVIPGTKSSAAGQTISISQRHILLRLIEESSDTEKGSRSVSSVCRLLWHSSVVNSSYTACLLASYAQSQLSPRGRQSLVRGPIAAVAICCSLSDVLLSGGDVVALWCDAYLGFICDLLDESVAVLTALETSPLSIAEQMSQISSQFSLLQSMLMVSIRATATHRPTATLIIEKLSLKGSEVKKKLNKWIKSCLKFGLHFPVVISGLSSFFSAARSNFLSPVSNGSVPVNGEFSLWKSVFAPKTVDYYHPSLVLQMMVSHSRFSATLRGQKQLTPNLSLLRLLLVLLSISLPAQEVSSSHLVSLGDRNESGSGSDQFLVNSLLQMYQGTVSDSDRLILRILHLLNSAGKCLALCTLKPVSIQSKKSFKGTPETGGSLMGTILQQLVYSTISQYPTWRSCAPQPIDIEGPDAEKSYRVTFSSLVKSVNSDWSGEENTDADHSVNKEGRSAGRKQGTVPHDSSDDSDTDSEEGDAHHSDTDSAVSIVSVENRTADWNCDDSDTYIPSVDSLSLCTDKVYDPCFWLPALHYSLLQQPHSVRQLANCGALSLVIAGTSSRCPVLRAIAMSSLQRIFELAKQQTPDKDAGFRERPQLLLLLNFLRNALDSCTPSSSGPIQFPSVISLFLSRAALHLLQPTHELFSKINKYLLSRPFCDFKDVPLYDLLLVDGDATTEQASRLTTFRIVRDGLTTRWDHLNLCRKNGYNRLMLLFPVLSKDVRAGHAVFDLLDKALGMQVSARYLLERCCVIPWLQQMASPSNSLDIDTTRSAGGTRIKASEESDPSDGAEDSDPRGRGARSAVSRSQASVLLAAPPRLLPRALCLMRRALGASYLLSAGTSSSSSTHLDQIQLAITTLIDVRHLYLLNFVFIYCHSYSCSVSCLTGCDSSRQGWDGH